jgi:hypothetical protein
LCPHSRIYPETKLATPLGIYSLFYLWFFEFSVAICSICISLLFCQCLSPQDTPERPSGSISLLEFCLHFQKFYYLQELSHCVHLQPARTSQVHILHIGSSANTSHLAIRWPARILSSRTVLHCLPASKIFENFEIKF